MLYEVITGACQCLNDIGHNLAWVTCEEHGSDENGKLHTLTDNSHERQSYNFV